MGDCILIAYYMVFICGYELLYINIIYIINIIQYKLLYGGYELLIGCYVGMGLLYGWWCINWGMCHYILIDYYTGDRLLHKRNG